MKKETYKNTLNQKSVEELVDIIFRKDDKEKEKNKLISTLERKINRLKHDIVELNSDVDLFKERCQDIATKAHNSELNYQRITTAFDKANTQNGILRIIIALLGAIVIIEFLIITTM